MTTTTTADPQGQKNGLLIHLVYNGMKADSLLGDLVINTISKVYRESSLCSCAIKIYFIMIH